MLICFEAVIMLFLCSPSNQFSQSLMLKGGRVNNFHGASYQAKSFIYSNQFSRMFGVVTDSYQRAMEEEEDDEDIKRAYPSEPNWSKMFPRRRLDEPSSLKPEMLREMPDFTKLKPDDPLFLDMPWPDEAGPEASAFARHMAWKRSLSDGERMRWQRWAVYQRMLTKGMFEYSVEDYIFQNMLRDVNSRILEAEVYGHEVKSAIWKSVADKFISVEEAEVRSVIGAFYSAFNQKNFEYMRLFWLPDDSVQLTLPGYESAKGQQSVYKLFNRMVKNAKPFGSISHKVLSINVVGFVAYAHVVETIGVGSALKSIKKNAVPVIQQKPEVKRVLSTLVLRKWNQQWRITHQHSVRMTASHLTGDLPLSSNYASLFGADGRGDEKGSQILSGDESRKREIISLNKVKGLLPMLPEDMREALENGGAISLSSRLGKDGKWERNLDSSSSTLRNDYSDTKVSENSIVEPSPTNENGVIELDLSQQNDEDDDDDDVDDDEDYDEDEDDNETSLAKKTVDTLRVLRNYRLITDREKDILLEDMINKMVDDDIASEVEIALDLMVIQGSGSGELGRQASRKKMYSEGPSTMVMLTLVKNAIDVDNVDLDDLREFASECKAICRRVKGPDYVTVKRGKDLARNDEEEEGGVFIAVKEDSKEEDPFSDYMVYQLERDFEDNDEEEELLKGE